MKKLFLLLAGCSIFSGCGHKDTYPDVPTLEFKSLVFGDEGSLKTFTLTATFTDGDGDIGYFQDRPNDSIFDDTLSQYYYNFLINIQFFKNNMWIDSVPYFVNNNDTVFYNINTRLPYLTQTGQNKGLKGDIDKTDFLPALFGDTIRFHAFIYDRALNKSNEIVTPGYYLQNP